MYLRSLILTLCTLSLVSAEPGQYTKKTTTTVKRTTCKTTTRPTASPTSCASGRFKVQMNMANGVTNYFFDFGSSPAFVGVEYNVTEAGVYTLTGTTLNSVAVPGAVLYTVSGSAPGPGAPPNGRAFVVGRPGTLDPSTGENILVRVTVIDQATCRLAFTDGTRTAVGTAGFRGGVNAFLGLPGTTTNFQEAITVRAIPA